MWQHTRRLEVQQGRLAGAAAGPSPGCRPGQPFSRPRGNRAGCRAATPRASPASAQRQSGLCAIESISASMAARRALRRARRPLPLGLLPNRAADAPADAPAGLLPYTSARVPAGTARQGQSSALERQPSRAWAVGTRPGLHMVGQPAQARASAVQLLLLPSLPFRSPGVLPLAGPLEEALPGRALRPPPALGVLNEGPAAPGWPTTAWSPLLPILLERLRSTTGRAWRRPPLMNPPAG